MMRNKKIKNAAKAVIFILICAIISCSLTRTFAAKWYDKNSETAIAKHFYELKEDSIEVLLLGSSQVAWSIDSVEFYKKYGIATYGIGGSHNNLLMNYYWLLEALKTQRNIKTVMLDVSIVFNSDPDEAADYMKNLQGMKWGKNKYNAIRDYYNKIETPETEEDSFFDVIINYFFTLNQYHTRWNELDEEDFDDTKYDIHNVMGYTANSFMNRDLLPYDQFIIDNDKKDNSDDFKPVQAEYTKKIIDECKKRGIQIVLIKTPKNSWSKTGSDYIQKLADEEGIDFLECTTDKALKEIGIDYNRDMRDRDHLNVRGAKKLADYFCEYLLAHGSYTDKRKDNVVSKKSLELYRKKTDACYLNTTLTPKEYLDVLSQYNYTTVIQSSGDISEYWTDELQQSLEKSGFTLKIADLKGINYIQAVRNGEVIREAVDKDELTESIRIIPSKSVKFVSDFGNTKTTPRFENPLKYGKSGLRITAFDEDTGEPISRATIYKNDGVLDIAIERTS